LRILHLIPKLLGGGAEQQLRYLAVEHARRGHEVHIAYTIQDEEWINLPNVICHKIKASSNYDPLLIFRIHSLVKRINPDIIQTWILQMDIFGSFVSKFNGIPFVFREPSSSHGYKPNIKNWLRVKMGKRAGAIVANSHGGDEYWSKYLPDNRRFVIKNGLPLTKMKDKYNFKYAISTKIIKPIILYVGRFSNDSSGKKNLNILLKAISIVQKKRSILLVLCGDGPQRNEIESLICELGIKEEVKLTGYLDSSYVWSLMKQSSVFISLSEFEGCPNSVMEAMVCGCSLVLSDIPAHRELIDKNGAIFVSSTDINAVAEAIILTLDDTSTSRRRAKVAQQISKEWSIKRMANAYEYVYSDVIFNKIK